MSDRYFVLMGSPRKRQVRGPYRSDHHAGWLEIDSFSWGETSGAGGGGGGPGRPRFRHLTFSRPSDSASMQLFHHCHAGEGFDLVLLDVWDDKAQRSKTKFELRNVMIQTCSQRHDGAIFTLDFEDFGLIPGSVAKTASTSPAMIRLTPVRAVK